MKRMMKMSENTGSEFSAHQYIEYIKGNVNLILTVPHGGRLRPKSIPNRETGIVVHKRGVSPGKDAGTIRVKSDKSTQELANYLKANIEIMTRNSRPHVIINHLHRSKMDPNREVGLGAFGDPLAIQAWQSYHSFIDIAKTYIEQQYQAARGLLLDIHGQSHTEEWIELGYTISSEQLDSRSYVSSDTSIFGLAEKLSHTENGKDIYDLIAGEDSFGGMLSRAGYLVVPSPSHKGPSGGHYYHGGYTTRIHGSKNKHNYKMDAIQIESPYSLRKSSVLADYAKNLASVIVQYLKKYYQL